MEERLEGIIGFNSMIYWYAHLWNKKRMSELLKSQTFFSKKKIQLNL